VTRLAVRLVAFIGFVLLIAPLLAVIVNAFNADEILSGWGGFTTRWFSETVHDEEIRSSAGRSVEVAAAVTVIATVTGTLAVAFAAYVPAAVRRLTDGLTVARVMMPGVIMAAGLVILFPAVHLAFGLWAVILGQSVWAVAIFIVIAGARRAGFDRRLEDAARDLGASPFRVLRTLVIPDLLPGIVAGALIVFTFSFDDVVTPVFLSGSETPTLPVTILARIHRGITPAINAVGVLVMLVTLSGLALATLFAGSPIPGQRRRGAT
jgi:ABC-type spermidine/putrescine transport system permease subunit II